MAMDESRNMIECLFFGIIFEREMPAARQPHHFFFARPEERVNRLHRMGWNRTIAAGLNQQRGRANVAQIVHRVREEIPDHAGGSEGRIGVVANVVDSYVGVLRIGAGQVFSNRGDEAKKKWEGSEKPNTPIFDGRRRGDGDDASDLAMRREVKREHSAERKPNGKNRIAIFAESVVRIGDGLVPIMPARGEHVLKLGSMTRERWSEDGVSLSVQSLTEFAHFVRSAGESVQEEAADAIAAIEEGFGARDEVGCRHRGKLYHHSRG